MKSRWADWFGSGEISTGEPIARITTQDIECKIATRLTISPELRAQIVMTGPLGEVIVNLHGVQAVDNLIADLIKVRDLMENVISSNPKA